MLNTKINSKPILQSWTKSSHSLNTSIILFRYSLPFIPQSNKTNAESSVHIKLHTTYASLSPTRNVNCNLSGLLASYFSANSILVSLKIKQNTMLLTESASRSVYSLAVYSHSIWIYRHNCGVAMKMFTFVGSNCIGRVNYTLRPTLLLRQDVHNDVKL